MLVLHGALSGALCALAFPALATGQSLADLARETDRNKERQGTEAKVYTGDDLLIAGGKKSRTDEAEFEKERTAAEEFEAAAAQWRQAKEEAEAAIVSFEREIERLESSLEDMTVGFFNQSRISREAQLEQAQQNLATARATLRDLRATGRSEGYS